MKNAVITMIVVVVNAMCVYIADIVRMNDNPHKPGSLKPSGVSFYARRVYLEIARRIALLSSLPLARTSSRFLGCGRASGIRGTQYISFNRSVREHGGGARPQANIRRVA